MMNEFVKRFITSIVLVVCFGGAYLHSTLLFTMLLAVVFVLTVVFEWSKLIGNSFGFKLILLSILYPGLPVLGMLLLNYRYRDVSFLFPLYPIFIAWTADTCGYLVGSVAGRHKVCPAISPGKSWEGLLASVVGVILLNYALMPFFKIDPFVGYAKNINVLVIVSVIQTVVAFLGGIFISYLKRKNGVKDTGNVLPGHGGFLDRFDSVFFTVFAVWGSIAFHSFKISDFSFVDKARKQMASVVRKVTTGFPFWYKKINNHGVVRTDSNKDSDNRKQIGKWLLEKRLQRKPATKSIHL